MKRILLTLTLSITINFPPVYASSEDDEGNQVFQPAQEHFVVEDKKNWQTLFTKSLVNREDPMGGIGRPLNIWCFDGGGIIGIIAAHAYAVADQVSRTLTHKSIYDYIDIFGGTSTGGILSIGINLPGENGQPKLSPIDMLRLYRYYGSLIFKKRVFNHVNLHGVFGTQYDERYLEGLMEFFCQKPDGQQFRYQDLLKPVFVASYSTSSDKGILFDTTNLDQVRNLEAAQVARATSAAPTYFNPAVLSVHGSEETLIDGGLWENDPSWVTLQEVSRYYCASFPALDRKDLSLINLVSFGAGFVKVNANAKELKDLSAISILPSLVLTVANAREEGTAETLRDRQKHHTVQIEHNHHGVILSDYQRFQIDLAKEVKALDNVNPAALCELIKKSKDQCSGDQFVRMLATILGHPETEVRRVMQQAIMTVDRMVEEADLARIDYYDHIAWISEYIFQMYENASYNLEDFLRRKLKVTELGEASTAQDYCIRLNWLAHFMVNTMRHNSDKTKWSTLKDILREGSHIKAIKVAGDLFKQLCVQMSPLVQAGGQEVHDQYRTAVEAYKLALASLYTQSSSTNGYMKSYCELIECGLEAATQLSGVYRQALVEQLESQIKSTKQDRSFISAGMSFVKQGWHDGIIEKLEKLKNNNSA